MKLLDNSISWWQVFYKLIRKVKIEKYAALFEVEMILNIFQRISDNRVIIYV